MSEKDAGDAPSPPGDRAEPNAQYGEGKLGRALRTYVAFKLANLVLAFVLQIVVVKILVPEQYATYAVLLAVLTAGERALSIGLDRTTMRFVPALTVAGDSQGLRGVLARIAGIRGAMLALLTVLCLVGAMVLGNLLPTPIDTGTVVAFYVWFVAYTLMIDADAFAQSWLAHFDSAIASFVEVVLRTALIVGAAFAGMHIDAPLVILIAASTSTVTAGWLIVRLMRFRNLFRRDAPVERAAAAERDPAFAPRRAPAFAMANYASTVIYLISSPPVTRMIASTGLAVVPLAAFSFIQTLAISLQRLFPGQLVLPTLEPVYMSRIAERGDRKVEALAGLSLVFKFELLILLAAIIVSSIAGREIVSLLSRDEYADYYFALPVLLLYVSLATSYRLLELVINMNAKQSVFLFLWPVSLAAGVVMYLTVGAWGLVSVLLFPLLEILVRVVALAIAFRRHGTTRIFDLDRSTPIATIAVVVTATALGTMNVAGISSPLANVGAAGVALLVFVAAATIAKPFRLSEYKALETALPLRLRFFLPFAGVFARG